MKKLLVFLCAMTLIALLMGTRAYATPTASYDLGGGNPYFDDYNIFVGVGNPSSPIWEVQVATSYNGNHTEGDYGTVDISAAGVLWGQTWYLEVDDDWGINDSYIQSFTIDTGSGIYAASGTPIFIPDNALRYAYIELPQQPDGVPEPATMLLFGSGLIGLGVFGRKKLFKK